MPDLFKDYIIKINNLKGTASELFQNAAYDELANRIGEEGALKALKQSLDDRKLTADEWLTYRKVRDVMHTNPIDVKGVAKEINELPAIALGLQA